MDTYRIVRFFQRHDHHRRVIETGLTLEQAQEHCNDPETSSTTCKSASRVRYTRQHGMWFDGYEKE